MKEEIEKEEITTEVEIQEEEAIAIKEEEEQKEITMEEEKEQGKITMKEAEEDLGLIQNGKVTEEENMERNCYCKYVEKSGSLNNYEDWKRMLILPIYHQPVEKYLEEL